MPPLIAALAAGRNTPPTAWMTVGPRSSAPAPIARPVARLPLKTSSISAIDPSIRLGSGMSAEAALFQRRKLRRNRLIATALLGAMAALFVATALVPQPGFWLLLVRATA